MKSSQKSAVPEISPTMRDALRMALDKGGKSLYRWPGGYWTWYGIEAGNQTPGNGGVLYHGTATIMALITRGLLDISERAGAAQFPIKVTLNHNSFEALKQ